MNAALRLFVQQRAQHCCEYCRLRQELVPFVSFQIEHIIAKQHGGRDDETNLALACPRCNRFKGPNIASLDPLDGALTPLFNPREHIWEEHFLFAGTEMMGLTAIGRATVRTLNMNDPVRIELRATLD